MTKQTDTVRIAYSWADRNGINPLPVVRYGSRQWETGNDEDEALSEACTHLETPAIAYPFESVITENRFQWKDLRWFLPLLAISCLAFAGFMDLVNWLRSVL